MSSALQCLEVSATDDVYTQALLAYVFGLAGRREQQQAQLQSLAQRSISAGTTHRWQWHFWAVPPSTWVTPCHPQSPETPGAGG